MEPQSCIISSKKLPTHHIHFGILVSQHIMTRYSPYFVYFVYYMYDYLGSSVTGDTLTQDKSTQDRSSQDRSSQDSLSQDRSRQEIWLDPNFMDLTFLNQSFFWPQKFSDQDVFGPKIFLEQTFLSQIFVMMQKNLDSRFQSKMVFWCNTDLYALENGVWLWRWPNLYVIFFLVTIVTPTLDHNLFESKVFKPKIVIAPEIFSWPQLFLTHFFPSK